MLTEYGGRSPKFSNCMSKGMGKQRREDKRNKRIKERVWTPRAVYHRTHRTCRGPGSYADGSRVAGVPVLIETGHYRERNVETRQNLTSGLIRSPRPLIT